MESMAARDGATSARRRRNRQLRAFHRHEVLSVKMALATALHHSAQPAGPVVGGPEEEVEYETHNATGTEHSTSGDAPWCASHGRLRGCRRGSSPRTAGPRCSCVADGGHSSGVFPCSGQAR